MQDVHEREQMHSGAPQKTTKVNKIFGLERYPTKVCEQRGKDLFQTVVLNKVKLNTPNCFGLNTSRTTKIRQPYGLVMQWRHVQ